MSRTDHSIVEMIDYLKDFVNKCKTKNPNRAQIAKASKFLNYILENTEILYKELENSCKAADFQREKADWIRRRDVKYRELGSEYGRSTVKDNW